ncbi:MAG: 30S ribosomal protein S17 [Armatimonadota bacterium]
MAAQRGVRRKEEGKVVSDKMDKTVVVRVERVTRHPLYRRVIRRSTKFHAHDERNECRVGDRVRIEECRPYSKMKRWRVIQVLERAK